VELLNSHGERLHTLLWRVTLREDVADDLLQDLAIKLASSDGFARSSNHWAYAHTVAARLAFDWRRRQKSFADVGSRKTFASTQRAVLDDLIHDERLACLLDVVTRLPQSMRQGVTLRYLEQYPYTQVAAAMGQTVPAVRMTCHRALRRLRDMLDTGSDKREVNHANP
jgi:RNA polymerase sigma factor (sigma-70 family)